jgi:hypothetical protein
VTQPGTIADEPVGADFSRYDFDLQPAEGPGRRIQIVDDDDPKRPAVGLIRELLDLLAESPAREV